LIGAEDEVRKTQWRKAKRTPTLPELGLVEAAMFTPVGKGALGS
jgi:hypothetical protein